ncbi:MAG: deoxyribonuclease IV [Candidatus Eisenbacteria bacterium]|nr:deoxyribonuclease IV [Candidatus Eisenbacteria bacterium]
MRFGIHVPKQRNLTATAEYARDVGCGAFQIFSGNPVGWRIGRLDVLDRDGFVETVRGADMRPALVHAPYLINLATGDRRLRRLSMRALTDAMTRAADLRAGPVVVHAGNHKGAGPRRAIERAVRMIARVLKQSPPAATLAVEGGAGKGTEIGVTFEELASIVSPFPARRVGVLLDTAHLWALGWDLRKADAVAALLEALDRGPGLGRLVGLHVNDSKAELGSRRDKHALWTEGRMGRRALRNLVRSPELEDMPLVFEIPGKTREFDRGRLASMRRMGKRIRGG